MAQPGELQCLMEGLRRTGDKGPACGDDFIQTVIVIRFISFEGFSLLRVMGNQGEKAFQGQFHGTQGFAFFGVTCMLNQRRFCFFDEPRNSKRKNAAVIGRKMIQVGGKIPTADSLNQI